MSQSQRELRNAAEQAFLNSLDQLRDTLKTGEVPKKNPLPPSAVGNNGKIPKKVSPAPIDPAELEQAVADIEAFMNSQHPISET